MSSAMGHSVSSVTVERKETSFARDRHISSTEWEPACRNAVEVALVTGLGGNMESNLENDRNLVSKYEAVFCVFMAVLAYLWRDNPSLVYPQILYLFATLMAFNLTAGVALRLWPAREWISTFFILANCGAITAKIGRASCRERV